MSGLTGLEVYNSVFNITEKNKFELCRSPEGLGFIPNKPDNSFKDSHDEAAKNFGVSDFSINDLQDETIGPFNFK